MKKSKHKSKQQLSFIKPQVKFFGGVLLKGKRKAMRPLSSKDSIHFVLRSSWAMGSDSFLASRNCKAIDQLISHFAKRFGVKIYRRAINKNHIHLLLRITNRMLYKAFIRALSGKIASHVMGHQQSFEVFKESRLKLNRSSMEGDELLTSKSFWEYRPFSRVVNWGKDFNNCVKYLKQNILEALGFISYTTRKDYYSKWISKQIIEGMLD